MRQIFALLAPVIGALLLAQPAVTQAPPPHPPTYPGLPSETPTSWCQSPIASITSSAT